MAEIRLAGKHSSVNLDSSKPQELFFTHTVKGERMGIKPFVSAAYALPRLEYLVSRSIIPTSDTLEVRKDPHTLSTLESVIHMKPRLETDVQTLARLRSAKALSAYSHIIEKADIELTKDGLFLRNPLSDTVYWSLKREGDRMVSSLPLIDEKDFARQDTFDSPTNVRGEYGYYYLAWPLFHSGLHAPGEFLPHTVNGTYMIMYEKSLLDAAEYEKHVAGQLDSERYNGLELRSVLDPSILITMQD